jgi:hypothetical protein
MNPTISRAGKSGSATKSWRFPQSLTAWRQEYGAGRRQHLIAMPGDPAEWQRAKLPPGPPTRRGASANWIEEPRRIVLGGFSRTPATRGRAIYGSSCWELPEDSPQRAEIQRRLDALAAGG